MSDWRKAASCRVEDPDLFFPKGSDGPSAIQSEQAKTVCRRCPSKDACLQFALDNNISDGIYGGLTDDERMSLRRSVKRGRTNPEDTAAKAEQARAPKRVRTLKTIFDDNTAPLPGGHLAWTGGQKPGFGGQVYTPKQLCFAADRGHPPAGRLRAGCGVDDCVLPAHLVEVPVEARVEPCRPCRRASTDTRTSSTKAVA